MAPTLNEVNKEALAPLFNDEITLEESYERAAVPFKEFMSSYTRQKDLELFLNYSGRNVPVRLKIYRSRHLSLHLP